MDVRLIFFILLDNLIFFLNTFLKNIFLDGFGLASHSALIAHNLIGF